MGDKLLDNILFVTAYKYINRDKWQYYNRSEESYLSLFNNLAINIKYNIVVFIEKRLIEIMTIKYKEYKNIEFYDIDLVDSFYNKYLEDDRKIMNSDIYKNKIPEYRKINPEHIYSEYNLINNSKINYIKHASNIKFYNYKYNYKFYSWIDFGMIREDNHRSIPKNINTNNISNNRITYQALLYPQDKRIDPNDLLRINTVYITGSSFIIPKFLINKFEKLWENKIIELHKKYITDDDQSIILQLYYDNPNLFDLKISSEWFNLFNIL